MKLSFIVPCYNEEKNAGLLLEKIGETFKKDEFEAVFINDGSSDNTGKELKNLFKTSHFNVKVVNFSRNFGKEAAIFAGLQNCVGDYISLIDADLQQDPKIVFDMVKILDEDEDVDCVCACQEKRSEGKLISALKSSFYKMANKFTEIDFVNGASDFRTFRSTVGKALLSVNDYFRFSKGIFSWVGFNTKYITYTAGERANGETKWGFKKLLKYAFDGIISFSTAPLRFATVLGTIATAFSVIYFIVTLIRKLVSSINVDGFTQLAILLAFFGGVQLFTIGIMGEYLAKNYIETKRRPIFIAKEILSYENKNDEKNEVNE